MMDCMSASLVELKSALRGKNCSWVYKKTSGTIAKAGIQARCTVLRDKYLTIS